jgi:Tol biopolymer transport system component
MAGDANADSLVNAGDVVYLIAYLFRDGPPPVFWECGDPNTDCLVNAADVVYLISYLFRQGPEPEIVECGWSEPVNLGPPINSSAIDNSISFSTDFKKLVIESARSGTIGGTDIWYSLWDSVSQCWSEPINCGTNVNSVHDDWTPSISPDGNKIYFAAWERPGGYGGWEIFVSTWDSTAGEWGVAENVGPNVNSLWADIGPFVSPDGTKLYFSSVRYFGGISVCEWEGDGWGEAVWLGEVVNETRDEATPSVTADGTALYFTRWTETDRHIFVSYWTGSEWGVPVELPPHINYPDIGASDPYIKPDGSELYFSAKNRPGGMGVHDIWVSERIPVQEGKRFINRKTSPVGKSR